MTSGRGEGTKDVTICVHPSEYFREVVDEAIVNRNIDTTPSVSNYLVDVLSFYISAENLFEQTDASGKRSQGMLAEKFLKATAADKASKIELLKKLGDMSLYISGFFGDSLQRKLVDIDYYVDMGGAAYQSLATVLEEEVSAQVYSEIARKFTHFVDVFTYVSEKSVAGTNGNLLRLYERYLQTGSQLAREQIVEQGLILPKKSNGTSGQ